MQDLTLREKQLYAQRGDDMKIRVEQKGDFDNTKNWLKKMKLDRLYALLEKYAQDGVVALMNATPVDSGKTAVSWGYRITRKTDLWSVEWINSNVNKGVPIAIILQYGHGTGTGGWVEGRDYINPAMQPIFDAISENVWKEIAKL